MATRKLQALIAVFAALTISTNAAQASATMTFSPAGDGGVTLVGNGDAGTTFPFDNSFSLTLAADNVFGPDGQNFDTSTTSGSITVGPDTTPILQAKLFTTGSSDTLYFLLDGSLNSGATTFNDVQATWPVGVLPFSAMTPGTYNDMFSDTVITIVPEPGSFTLLAAGVTGLVALRRRRGADAA